MQQHLCRTLAHYAVYLAAKLGLPIQSSKEQFVLECAHSMWNKEGCFTWITREEECGEGLEEEDPEGLFLEDDISRIDVDRWAFHLSEYYSTGNQSRYGSSTHEPSPAHTNRSWRFDIQDAICNYPGDFGLGIGIPGWLDLPLTVPKALNIFPTCQSWSVGPFERSRCWSGGPVNQEFLLV